MSDQRETKRSILIVEDETLVRMLAVDFFEDAGFHVIEVETADQGARVLEGVLPIHGIFTDIETPGAIDGVALARITHALRPDAAIVVVSGRVRPSVDDLPHGARFVPKPYEGRNVLKILHEMLAL